jgi:hypothetical protein
VTRQAAGGAVPSRRDGRDEAGLTIDDRRAQGVPLVRWHSQLGGYTFNCPFWPGTPACGIGDLYTDFPTEDAARKAWKDHHGMRHPGMPYGWPDHIPGRRGTPAPRTRAAGGTVDADQVSLW